MLLKFLVFAALGAVYVIWSTGHVDDVLDWCVRKAKGSRDWMRKK